MTRPASRLSPPTRPGRTDPGVPSNEASPARPPSPGRRVPAPRGTAARGGPTGSGKAPEAAAAGCIKPSVVIARGAQILKVDDHGINVITANVRTTVEVVPQVKLTAEQQEAGKVSNDAAPESLAD